MRDFIEQVNSYYPLSEETANALLEICTEQFYKKTNYFRDQEKQQDIITLSGKVWLVIILWTKSEKTYIKCFLRKKVSRQLRFLLLKKNREILTL